MKSQFLFDRYPCDSLASFVREQWKDSRVFFFFCFLPSNAGPDICFL